MISKALRHFRIDRVSETETIIWIDVSGHSMNVFNDEVIAELDFVVSGLESQASGAVVFRSAKKSGFFAGADVHQIAGLNERSEVCEVIARGQKLFARIENLRIRTVAAIHGPCLGGGLEFALACRHRIVLDDRHTRLGLPEIQLGLIPGWGGTQRLPRLVGLMNAIPLILKGKKLTARSAWKMGLADCAVPVEDWESVIERFLAVGSDGNESHRMSWKKAWLRSATDSAIGRWLIVKAAARQVAGQGEHYPALSAALRSMSAAHDRSVDGFAVEKVEFANLIRTPTCRNLLNLFLKRDLARRLPVSRRPESRSEVQNRISSEFEEESRLSDQVEMDLIPPIRRIGVIGAGAMGSGIAQLAASKGLSVVIKELTSKLASEGLGRISGSLDELVLSKRILSQDRNDILERITTTENFEDLSDCDLVIEAVVEKMEVKRGVFASLDAVLKPHAVVVSNTSALSVGKMGEVTERPDRVGGLHFFNPVHRMELIEVVRTNDTSDGTVAALLRFAKLLGKTPIITSDSPGFLVNRVLFPYIGEAVRMVMEGSDTRKIDREMKKFGMPMGPLRLIDHVGLDVAWHVASTLEDVLPESSDVIRFLGQMVARGWNGRKSGQGFYHYDADRRGEVNDLSGITRDTTVLDEDGRREIGVMISDGLTATQRRLIYPMINEVGFCMQDGVVSEPWMADLAMILGTGFAPYTGGPLALADGIASDTLMNNLHVMTVRYGTRFKPSAWLVERDSTSTVTIGGGAGSEN